MGDAGEPTHAAEEESAAGRAAGAAEPALRAATATPAVLGALAAGGRSARQIRPEAVLALQRSVGNAAVARALAGAGGPGRPFDAGTRTRISSAFGGADLSTVRVHTDAPRAQPPGARAVTAGEHIAFAPGEYQPGTPLGDALIAHEVAHVIQQRRGSAEGTSPAAAAIEKDANRSAASVLARLWARSADWGAGIARDARPRLLSPLALRACIPGCSTEKEKKLKTIADELLAMKDPADMADRLANVEQSDLETAKRALESDGGEYRGTVQAQVLEWELAWRARDWGRLIVFSDGGSKSIRVPYAKRIAAGIMAGQLTVKANGQASDWASWVETRLDDLMENPAGFRVVALLLATKQTVTLKAPQGAGVGKGSTTERVIGDDDSIGRYDKAAGKAGTGTGSTVVLDNTVASNQLVLGGTPAAPTMIDADETVTMGHELIHALHNARGENISPGILENASLALGGPSSFVKDSFGEHASAEELWTIEGRTSFLNFKSGAAQSYNVTQSPSENDLRRERGLPLRQSHYGALNQFYVTVKGGEHAADLVAAHYRFKAPNKGDAAPTAAIRSRLLAVITGMTGFTAVPDGLTKIPLPHPSRVVLQVRFIAPRPDLVDAAGLLEAVP